MSAGIEFECPHCRRVTRVPADLAGKQGRCAQCRKILEVPNPDLEGSARRTSHLRHADRAGFELASSTVEAEKLPDEPQSTMRKWDFTRLSLWVWVALVLVVVLPPVTVLYGFYAIVAGHRHCSRELAVTGWVGLIAFQVVWLAVSVINFGMFLLPLITIGFSTLLLLVHIKWIEALIRRKWATR